MSKKHTVYEKYLLALRVIQPARVQDIFNAYCEIWGEEPAESLKTLVYEIHDEMKSRERIMSVRRGTYILNAKEMVRAGQVLENERSADNARLFLMKEQRIKYAKRARRHG
jgi:hypothetical protein